MEIIISGILVAAGLVLLCIGGNWLVGGGVMIAKRFRISSFVIGMTVVAYGTSTPELAASIAAAGEHSAIILGNIIGSNIANIGMVIGISAILLPLIVERNTLRKEIPIMIGASVLLVVLSADGQISQYDGLILLGGLAAVMIRTVRMIKDQRTADSAAAVPGSDAPGAVSDGQFDAARHSHDRRQEQSSVPPPPGARFYAKNIGMIGAGIMLLYAGAILTVENAVILAGTFGLSEKIIGLTVVAIGTSLPELITSIMAIRKGEGDIGVGNIIGSNIYNVLMIMGVGAALGGVAVSSDTYVDYGIMLAFGAALLIALRTKVISRPLGACIAAAYAAYLAVSLLK